MKPILFWVPRVLTFLFAFFIMIFSFDVFSSNASFWEKVLGFLVHSIPTFVIIFIALIAWKKPLWSALLYLALFIAFTIFFKTFRRVDYFMLISFPILLIAILYYLDYWVGKRK